MAAVSSRCSGRPLDALPLLMNVCVLNGYTPGVQHRNSAWKEDAAVGQAVLRHLFASGCAALKRFETTAIRGHMLHIAGADEVHDKKTTTRDLNTSLTVLPERRPCARHDTCTTRRQQQETSIHHSQYCQREGPVHGMTQQAPEEGPMGPEMHWTALHEKIF
ncbi:uncharacterized protein LOC144792272 isoform X3 [Lissotriton helveticus]